ncbi:sensor domain-containing protein [Brachybacterium sp. AOP43-C2-M15]|uniref:sensor domain-containing protein n=1 Tax=Brachybacterium sp. AOP43-C2-M15 TaxID=3457661 RepID=UPI004033DFBB
MFLVPDRRSLRRLGPDLALLLTGLPLTLLAVAVLLPLAAISTGLAVLWVGVLLFPLTLTLASGFAHWDRARLRRWGMEIADPRYRPTGAGARGLLRRTTDARRWLDLGFEGLIALPVRVLTATTALAWGLGALAGLTSPVWGRLLPPQLREIPGQWALALVAGLLLALTLPAMVHLLARLDAILTAPLLGGAESDPRLPAWPGSGASRLPTSSDARLREAAWTWMTIAFLAFVLVVVAWPVTVEVYDVHPATAMVVTTAGGAAALLGARWPWAGLALSAVSALAMMLVTAPAQAEAPWPWPVTALLAQCLTLSVLAVLHRWYWVLSAWSAGAVLTLAALVVTDPATMAGGTLRAVTTNGVVLVAISGGVVLLGLTARQWILVRGQVERAQTVSAEEMRRRRELEERGRIARELHDVVAHSMSVITVQAGTARFRLQHLDEATVSEFEDIAASSRQALGEMRSLLAILRTDDSLAEVPMPGLGDVEELVVSSRSAGAAITAELEDVPAPPTVGLTGYRVVQEGLSNALRHARGAAIEVRVLARAGVLLISVLNGPPPPSAAPQERIPGAGLGLAGTRERVGALGGTVENGPTPGGGYALRVRIPLAGPLPG